MLTRTAIIPPAALLLVAWMQLAAPVKDYRKDLSFDHNETIASYSPETLKFMSFGYDRAISGLLWLRFLQYTPPEKVAKGQLSWIYRDLHSVSALDPEFYPVYEHGGIFLSVITEDKEGAEQIFLKGIQQFPLRWRIRAYLAYHYQFEMSNSTKASEQYYIGSTLPGAPYILKVLASNYLKAKEGTTVAVDFLEDMLRDTKDPLARKKIQQKIEKLQEKIPKEK